MTCKKALLAVIAAGAFFSNAALSKQSIYVPSFFVDLSEHTEVPADILYALAVKEVNTKMSDKTVAPWPFTLNVNSIGYRYATYDEMMLAVNRFLLNGTNSIDIGLFQVNWRWNGHRAESIHSLGLPFENGKIAAQILKEHYQKYGDWAVAAGRYHNPANRHGRADNYEQEYRDILSKIQSGEYQRHLQRAYLQKQRVSG